MLAHSVGGEESAGCGVLIRFTCSRITSVVSELLPQLVRHYRARRAVRTRCGAPCNLVLAGDNVKVDEEGDHFYSSRSEKKFSFVRSNCFCFFLYLFVFFFFFFFFFYWV